MAVLLVRTVEGENTQRYWKGDVVAVLPEDHVFGRLESLKVWTEEGYDPALWPGGFAIVKITGLSLQDAQQFLASGSNGRRRAITTSYTTLERRTLPERETLTRLGEITRDINDVDVLPALLGTR